MQPQPLQAQALGPPAQLRALRHLVRQVPDDSLVPPVRLGREKVVIDALANDAACHVLPRIDRLSHAELVAFEHLHVVGVDASRRPGASLDVTKPHLVQLVRHPFEEGTVEIQLEMIHREFQEPVSGEFRRTFEEHNLGLPLDTALQKLAQRVPSLDVHFFVSAVLLQKRTGGNLAEILDKLAYVIRERFKLRGRIKAVSAHGRMTATALSAIPVCVAVLMFFTNPDYVTFFFTDEIGNMMMGAAVFLQVVGFLVMKKITNIEV